MTDQQVSQIVLVEDEPDQRETLTMLFEAEGYNVEGFDNAEDALAQIDRTPPDLVVTDVKLPLMDGFTMFESIRSNSTYTSLPFVFITGYNDPVTIKRLENLEGVTYVTKPYEIADLLSLIRKVLHSAEPSG